MNKKIILIAMLLVLSACSNSRFEAISSKQDAPAITKATVEFDGKEGVMDVEFRPGTPWPNIHADVEVTKDVDMTTYVIKRKDNGVRFYLTPKFNMISNEYICSECVAWKNADALPVFWVLEK